MRSARPASLRGCMETAPSRTGTARELRRCISATVSPWPVTPMNRTRRSARASTAARSAVLAERDVPLGRVHEAVQLDQIDMADLHSVERAADLLSRGQ